MKSFIQKLQEQLGFAPAPSQGRAAQARYPRTQQGHHRPQGGNRTGTDLIGVIGFHHSAFYISLPAEPWGAKLAERVQTLPGRINNYTNIAAGLRLALEMSRKCPKGSRRRIWLLSDGEPNVSVEDTIPAAQAIADARINLNVVAFGEGAGSPLLRQLAAQTQNGKFVTVGNLREMSAALKPGGNAHRKREHRQEVAILVVDCSPSMNERDMGNGLSRIEAVRDAIHALAQYKATVWS